MLSALKPSVRSDDPAAMRALQQGHEYVTMPVLGQPGVWSVWKAGMQQPYRVDAEAGTCTCPHYTSRLRGTGKVCKHGALLRLKLAIRAAKAEADRLAESKRRREAMFGPDTESKPMDATSSFTLMVLDSSGLKSGGSYATEAEAQREAARRLENVRMCGEPRYIEERAEWGTRLVRRIEIKSPAPVLPRRTPEEIKSIQARIEREFPEF